MPISDRFCSVFAFKERLFVAYEQGARGPRTMVFPPKEVDRALDAGSLGDEIERALAAYGELGRSIPAQEWEVRNRQLLDFFGERSVAAFERKKRDVTVRQEVATGQIALFGRDGREVGSMARPLRTEIGQAVKSLLGL